MSQSGVRPLLSKRTASRQSSCRIEKVAVGGGVKAEGMEAEEAGVGLDTINADLCEGPIELKDTQKSMRFRTPDKRSPKNSGC